MRSPAFHTFSMYQVLPCTSFRYRSRYISFYFGCAVYPEEWYNIVVILSDFETYRPSLEVLFECFLRWAVHSKFKPVTYVHAHVHRYVCIAANSVPTLLMLVRVTKHIHFLAETKRSALASEHRQMGSVWGTTDVTSFRTLWSDSIINILPYRAAWHL